MAGQAGRLQGQDRSAVNYPSSGHARRCLIWLSCDNRRTRYTAPDLGSKGYSFFDVVMIHWALTYCTVRMTARVNVPLDMKVEERREIIVAAME
ncbi:hypothetical protein J6590_100299 [Homalodisca vitripennis]|nr:hypothetical protein J6590_100299 [Homalodisca vitripennis]